MHACIHKYMHDADAHTCIQSTTVQSMHHIDGSADEEDSRASGAPLSPVEAATAAARSSDDGGAEVATE